MCGCRASLSSGLCGKWKGVSQNAFSSLSDIHIAVFDYLLQLCGFFFNVSPFNLNVYYS